MALLSAEELKARVQTTAADTVIEDLLDAAEQAIDDALGPVGQTSELLRASGPRLMLALRATEIVSVRENGSLLPDTAYELRPSGQLLMRKGASRWSGDVDVAYEPRDDLANRRKAQAALVALDLTYRPGLTSQRIGEYSEAFGQGDNTYIRERNAILSSLTDGLVLQ
jgi:hypothetical protein